MKQIINAETGEIEEIEEQNEIVERKLYEVGAIDEATFDFLEQYQTMQEQFEIFKFNLTKAMEENGIKKWDNDYFVATAKEESLQKRIDTDRLKEDGLYDKYLKLVPVKSSLQIRFKKEK